MNKTCVFIGGTQIGVSCLKQLLKKGVIPELVIGNLDDDGTNKDWYPSLVKIAKSRQLPTIVERRIREAKIIKEIKVINPEIIFCIGGMQLIPPEILEIPKLGCLNIHPSLLPKYRGRYSTAHTIFNGEKYAGTTVHWMDKGIDSGPIIMQKKVKIEESDTAKSLYNKCTNVGEKLFVQFLDLWLSGKKIPAKAQDESQATYFPKELPGKGEIDWSWDGKKIRNFIRAMTFEPFSPVSFEIGSKKMVIVDEKYFKRFK